MPALSHLHFVLLFAAGLAAGTVDAIAGGGGIISLPTLLGLGFPVPLALGTNKLGAAFGTSSSTWSYARRGLVDLRRCVWGVVFTAVGALAGTFTVRKTDPEFLARCIPWLLAVIVVYMVFKPRLGETSRHHLMETVPFYLMFGLALGFYDGFFGPGVGSFWTIAFVMVLGFDFLQAAGYTKVMNFTSNTVALLIFAWSGVVVVLPGLALGAGQLLGGWIGAHLAMTRGARFVRPVFLVMAGLTVLKLFYQHYLL